MKGTYRSCGARLNLDASAGIRAALKVIGEDATRRVPVGDPKFADSGELRDSQTIRVRGNTGGIGYRAPSAVPAHERLDVAPANGQRKYLETALNSNRREALAAIALHLSSSSSELDSTGYRRRG